MAAGVIVLDFAGQAVHVATATTAVYSVSGWTASSILGATFAACGLIVWTISRAVHHTPR